MISELLRTGIAWILLFPGIFALGSLLGCFVPFKDKQLRGICYFASGLVFLSYFVVLLSHLGLLIKPAIWTLIAVLFIFGSFQFKELFAWILSWRTFFYFDKNRIQNALFVFAILAFLSLLAGTLTPEIGGDALTYQIDMPKEFLRRHSLAPILYNDNSYFPLLMNNLYLIGLATGGVFAAKFFHCFVGILAVLAIAQTIKLETGNQLMGRLGALIFLQTPAVFNLLSTTYVDVSVAAYLFFSLLCALYTAREKNRGGFFLSGLFAGTAIATKYLSLTGVLAVVFTIIACGFMERRRISFYLSALILLGLGIFSVCGYWLIRNWILTGNPFYPYWGFLFGLTQRPPIDYYDIGMGKNFISYLFGFFNMAIQPNAFGSNSTRISLFYFLLFPLAIYAIFRHKKSQPYFIFALILYTIWFFLVQMDRWILPVLPPLIIAAAFGYEMLKDDKFKKVLMIGALILLGIEIGGGIYHYRYAYKLYTGLWSLEEYGRKMERTVPIADWINAHLPQDTTILIESEPRKFYIKRAIIADKNLNWHTQYRDKGQTPEEIQQFLKELKVQYLLISDSISRPSLEPSPLQRFADSVSAQLLIEIPSENIRDERFTYRLYQLKA